jgi:feruloyl-CoA synthase
MGIRPVPMYRRDAIFEPRPDGSLLVCMREPLEPYPIRLTERLEHWAALAPDRVFLARRAGEGWRSVSYDQALDAASAIGQALLDRRLSITREPDMWAHIKRSGLWAAFGETCVRP